ncbi:epithelial membrane protein 2-like [Podarcis raffonei]|uniref:epithelial membrane protein 2-like n=1 Tax=Podarcis raffonei TaxID=65483 RepID=UPI0023297224|nr:epithelial membrane protein 2-like [Podarcis raffonei]
MHILQISAVICAFISLVLLLIALGSDYWIQSAKENSGLWAHCSTKILFNICLPFFIKEVPGFYHATRTFLFFGVIAGAISCIGLCGNFFSFQLRSISKTKSSAIASLVAALCVMIGMAIFTGQTGGIAPYGWAFGLGWATFPLFLITGGLAFALDRTVSTAA